MVFYCAKGYQQDLVGCQVEEKERQREQRYLNQIEEMEQKVMGESSTTLQESFEGYPAMRVEDIRKLVNSGALGEPDSEGVIVPIFPSNVKGMRGE